jgi:gamma-glutamyl-gamma-aminobutyrate hydrolase PuuD
MKIAITQRVIDFRNGPYDSLDQGFYRMFSGHALSVIPNSLDHFNSQTITDADLIVFSGGNSMVPGNWQYNEQRLRVEKHALDLALMYKKPVLGISRGTQFLTISLGGSINTTDRHTKDHIVYYKNITKTVHSRHEEHLEKIPAGAAVIARDAQGMCESWKLNNIVTVLWHPERMTDCWMPDEVYAVTGLTKE